MPTQPHVRCHEKPALERQGGSAVRADDLPERLSAVSGLAADQQVILAWFGGSPGVWTAAMLFCQLVLFVGYAYAHVTTRLLGPRRRRRGRPRQYGPTVVAALRALWRAAGYLWAVRLKALAWNAYRTSSRNGWPRRWRSTFRIE